MNTKAKFIRLMVAVVLSIGSCFFVVAYTRFSLYRFQHEHPGGVLICGTAFFTQWGGMACAAPILSLVAGLFVLWKRHDSEAAIETVIGATWLLSLFWAGACLLFWQVQNVPMFSHMEWHY